MKIYYLPQKISALLFDMDLTLYSHAVYGQSQIDTLLARLAARQGKTFDEMKAETDAFRAAWAQDHHGEKISLSKVIMEYGVTMEENIRWRDEEYHPEKYITRDEKLVRCMESLSKKYRLAIVTNNTTTIAEKTLALLGAASFFPREHIVGLDTLGIPKPHKALYLKAAAILGVGGAECVSIGDRYDIDLVPPLQAGMGGILVDGVEDVYTLEAAIAQ